MRNRLAISQVGTVVPGPNGIEAIGWGFSTPALEAGQNMPVDPIAGGLAGWTAVELHAIAHGVPCDCPIGQAHAVDGLLD